jgi:hypothetical protein
MGYSSADPRNYLAIGRQADATTEATSFKFLKYLGDSGFDVGITAESVFEGGDGQDQGLHYRSQTRPDGSFDVYVRPDAFAFLSAYVLGSGVTPASTAAIASHLYTPNATMPYLTVEQAWGGGNKIDRVSGALLTGMTVTGEAGAPWRITTPFVGGGTPYYRDGAASALSPSLETGDPAMYAGGAYLVNGATEVDIRRFTYNFARSVDDGLFTVNTFRRKVVPLSRTVSLDFQMIWQDQSIYNQIAYGGGSVTPESLATGSFHAERRLTASQLVAIDVPNLRYTSVGVNRLEPDGQTVVLDVSAMGVKAGTGIVQHRANITGQPTSYLQ